MFSFESTLSIRDWLWSILILVCRSYSGFDSVSEDPETVEDVYEPFLMQLGFLARTPRGRVATKLAYDHLGLVKASSGEQPRLF